MRLTLDIAIPSVVSSSSSRVSSISQVSNAKSNTSFIVDGGSDLVLIELQGQLLVDGTETSNPDIVRGSRVGKLDMSDMSLTIGHHRVKGSLVKLANPMAILRHTLPKRTDHTPSSAFPSPFPSSSPAHDALLQNDVAYTPSAKRRRVDQADKIGDNGHDHLLDLDNGDDSLSDDGELAVDENNKHEPQTLATPAQPSRNHLLPSSASTASTKPPATPVNVTDLKHGKHEIVAIIRQKLVFSKRPEPIVNLEESDEE